MENQHTLIKGYRDLSHTEIELMNEIKAVGEECGVLVKKLYGLHNKNGDLVDGRWFNIGRTYSQLGFMTLLRAVAKPNTF